ncbi:MAG: putative sulfate exporter family transporter [Candidatus Nanopelagicaceae bacterium]|nr:putative sulfate exporter family transporter [Candidatus Nanopelagicaceae bacterium]
MKLTANNLKYFSIIAFNVAIAYAVSKFESAISPLFFSMVLGLIFVNSGGWSSKGKEAATFAARKCLRLGVVLLGFQISIDKFVEVGLRGLLAVVIIVSGVFLGLRFFAKRAGLSDSLSTFIAGGFAICGATAIAAISSTRKSEERDVSYAVALVALCGTLSVFVIPGLATMFSLSDATAGAWIGAAVHDVGQVIAAASLMSPEALDSAVIVKLTRVVLLIPLILFLSATSKDHLGEKKSLRTATPTFVIAFVICALIVNALSLPETAITAGKELSKIFLSLGLFGMGLGVKWASIKALGAKPLLVGLVAWVVCGGFALGVITAVGL